MRHEAEMRAILKQVELWPAEEKRWLAERLTNDKDAVGQRPTIDQLIGAGRGEGPAPTDEDVARWIDEHRMEKYGR